MRIAIFVIFVLSGFAGLTYELVWTRHLMLIFGVSSQAISTVLAAFMAGLALGSVILGRIADRARYPLRLYAILEAGIGLSALALPAALGLVNDAYVALARAIPAHSYAFTALRFLLCFGVVLVPATLMGGTLPAMSREFIRRPDVVGRGAGLLYGANTLGGILGAAATGFLLLRVLGSHRTSLLAVSINLAVAVAALVLSLRSAPAAAQPPADRPADADRETHSAADRGRPTWLPQLVLAAFGLAGAASLAYEVLWTRMLVYFMDLTIYSFTTILVTFLTGIAVGSFLFARAADRVRNLLALFGIMQLGIALSAVLLMHVIGRLPAISRAAASVVAVGDSSPMVSRFAVAFAFMIIPTVLMGGVFPVVARIYARDLRGLGRSLGDLYAANTVGCVIGSLGAGFVMLPLVGAQQAVALVALLNGALGLALLAPAVPRRRAAVAYAVPAALLVAGAVWAWRAPPAIVLSKVYMGGQRELIFHREGPEATLSVLRDAFGSRELNLNGTSTAFSSYGDIAIHKLLAHPPALLVDEPRSALLIGFGLGSTAWAFAQHPLERIDCVELVGAERESAQFFLPENGNVLEDPRFELIIGDGRNHLLTTSRTYDIITFNAIHPAFSPYLYTREFYELCRSRLTDKGVVCAWVPTNSAHFASLLRTFQEVFPHCSLWWANPAHLAMVGTPGPLRIDYRRLSERMSSPELRRNLAETHMDDPARLLSHCFMDEDAIRRYWRERNALLNTDDLPHVGYQTRELMKTLDTAVEIVYDLLPYWTSPSEALVNPGLSTDDPEEFRRTFEGYCASSRLLFEGYTAFWGRDIERALALADQALEVCPEDTRGRYRRALILSSPLWDSPMYADEAITQRRYRELGAVIENQEDKAGGRPGLPPRYLTVPRVALARLLLAQGQSEEAGLVANEILAYEPDSRVARELLTQAGRVNYTDP